MRRLTRPLALATASLGLLAALACNNYHPKEYSPTQPGTVDSLSLSASATAIPADGFSTATITAQIDPAAAPDRRTVVFTTSAGTFVGATDSGGKKVSVAADTLGRASVQLQSQQVIQTATVDASVSVGDQVLVDKRISIAFVAVGPNDLLRLSTSPSVGTADGATPVHVFADLSSGLPAGQRTVTFTTTLGTFADSKTATTMVTADSGNRATADLVSPAAGQARITATVANTSATTLVDFSAALPETIVVSPDKPAIKASLDDSTTVTATLFRSVGTVTPGTVVTYKVIDPATKADLHFIIRSVTPSNSSQQSQAVVIAGNTTFRGTATIVASVGSVQGTADIDVIAP